MGGGIVTIRALAVAVRPRLAAAEAIGMPRLVAHLHAGWWRSSAT